MVFVGTHDHTLDDKGRLVLPARFRSHFADSAYLLPNASCISLWEPERFEKMIGRLGEQARAGEIDPRSPKQVAHASSFVRPDAQGRITIPERLRAFASLEQNVVVCGAVESLEIWNAETWAAMSAGLDQSVADLFRDGGGI